MQRLTIIAPSKVCTIIALFYILVAIAASVFILLAYRIVFFKPIKVDGRTGIPKDILGKGLTAGALKKLDRETRPESEESEEEDDAR